MRDLAISYGASCMARKWSNKTITWQELGERLKTTIRTPETVAEYHKMKRSEKELAKDKGGFVGGHLKGNRRLKQNVALRSMLTLDVDAAKKDFVDQMEMLSSHEAYLYSTHGHTPDAPRIRVIIPMTRDITAEEYVAISRYFAAEWNIDQFDKCSFYPHQLMYWPTTPSDGEYVFLHVGGEWLDPDAFLAQHPNWKDLSLLPTTKSESVVKETSDKKAEDPTTKDNIVGVFCRCFSITDVMAKFLSDVYRPSDMIPGRYDFIRGEGAAGVQVYEDKFAYSHHATDPASGMTLNAFDLVRIHKFGNDDEKKTFKQMSEFAMSLDEVKMAIAKERENSAATDFSGDDDDWQKQLVYAGRSMKLENCLANVKLILENDPDYAGFAFNELAGRVEVTGTLPWNRPTDNDFWRDPDTSQLISKIDEKYGSFAKRHFDVAFEKIADDRRFHPVRDYLDALPKWDGKKRVEKLLIECLDAEDTPYVRAVTRKTLAAAVARIYHPGTKFDSVLVFDGVQGIGKSTLFRELAGEKYYSETLSLTDMNDKSGAEKLQGFWIVEIAELAGMKKADIEKVKAFLSTSDDKYRPSYGRTVESHPRQSVIIASVNGERGYLRDITGNRRFWVVKLNRSEGKKEWNVKRDRDQIWAEAKAIWEAGEKLYLEGELVTAAEQVQKDAMEQDERKGLVEEYLNTLLPKNWDDLDIYDRRNYFHEKANGMAAKGEVKREFVSNLEIWCECFGRNSSDLKPSDSYTIAALMTQIPGWERTTKSKKLPIYGKQRLYMRVEEA